MRTTHLQLLLAISVGSIGCVGSKTSQHSAVPVSKFRPAEYRSQEEGSAPAPSVAHFENKDIISAEHTDPTNASNCDQVRLASSLTVVKDEPPLRPTPPAKHLAVASELSLTNSEAPAPVVGWAAPFSSDQVWQEEAPSPSDLRQATSADVVEDLVQLNLPSVLAVVDGGHPVVGFAQWRVQEAYAELALARSMWLPSIQAGFSFHRHDGNYQASNGQIVDVNRNSFQYGLGAGGVGAGTTPNPGVVAQFHLADALFQPKIAKSGAWANGHAASAVRNEQLLQAGIAYFQLLDSYQDQRIIEETHDRLEQLTKITVDFAEAGQGLQADADRLNTELTLNKSQVIAAQEQVALSSARLARELSLDVSGKIVPMDVNAIPVNLVPVSNERGAMIGTALASRPELREAQSLVAAACEAYRREKYAPFVPSVLLGFSTGGFGGGLGNNLNNVQHRYDFDAQMSWQVRNLGFGEKAAKRRRAAQVEQAKFEKLRRMDEVAAQVTESLAQTEFRKKQLEITRDAILTAKRSYERNVERIRDGQGLPIEVLQSVQALESAERAYMRSVIGYNQAQLRLLWSLGWPVSAAGA